MINLKCKLRQLRYDVRYLTMNYPPLYLLLTKFGDGYGTIADSETDIVIEGFPRSANTFAVNAFRLAQTRKVKIAHHKHSITQFLIANKFQIPTLLVIRTPEEAIISFLIREPCISIEKAFKYWIDMHKILWKYKSNFVIGDFEEITTEFGKVIERINYKFNTNFNLFEHNQTNVNKCFDSMENYSKKHNQNQIDESLIARPSQKRKELKSQIKEQLNYPQLYHLKQYANGIYYNYLEEIKKTKNY